MSSASIRSKIKSGLSKAVAATGSASSEKIYLVGQVITGGETPLNPAAVVETDIELVNAIFTLANKDQFSGEILKGDKALISDSDVIVSVGDKIKQGAKTFVVVAQEVKEPTSDVLAYISQVRLQ